MPGLAEGVGAVRRPDGLLGEQAADRPPAGRRRGGRGGAGGGGGGGGAAARVAASASKPQIGHLLGAAGSAELAIAALGVRDGFAPPTLNLDDPDTAGERGAT